MASLKQPVAVLGSTGFIGRNLVAFLQASGIEALPASRHNLWEVLDNKPKTLFHCIAYGTKPGENDDKTTYDVNFILAAKILEHLKKRDGTVFIHAGSSVEYGANCAAPKEDTPMAPVTPYAVSKAACAGLLWYCGKSLGMACANLRLYSVYGKHQAENQLIPVVIRHGREGMFPRFVPPEVSYDYIHVEDVCRSFVMAAANLPETHYGESFNIGTGVATTIKEVAMTAKKHFGIMADPEFVLPYPKTYYGKPWHAHTEKAKRVLGFEAEIPFAQGFAKAAS